MIRNYFKIALRSMMKQKGYTAINLLGLSTGMAATILILLFVEFELSYDRYHDKSEHIYRASREWLNEDGKTNLHLGHLAPPFAPLIENDFPGVVDQAVRVMSGWSPLIITEDKSLVEEGFFFGDADLFKVFSWKFITGDPNTALSEPNSVVLTERAVEKYFDGKDPIGEQITYDNFGMKREMKVTGVIENIPPNSHFEFDIMGSMLTVEDIFGRENMMSDWGSNNYSTYLLFPDENAVDAFEAGLPEFIDRHLGGDDPNEKASETNKLHLLPLVDIHLKSHLDSEIGNNGNIEIIYIFTIIAILILVIACINFMNLATARSGKRSREVGMRKVLGAQRILLIRQFLAESMIFAILSFTAALLVVYIGLPYFADFVDKPLSLNLFDNPLILGLSIGIVLFVGLLAGSYPAFFLSAFKPIATLKGESNTSKNTFNLRSLLVIMQFCISAGLIIAVGVVQDQLEFVKSKDLGFNKDNVIVLPAPADLLGKYESVKTKLESHPSITEVSLASRVPSGRLLDSQGTTAEVNGEMQQINFRIADVHIDFSYLEQLGVPLAAGRYFDPDIASDSSLAFIINETAARTIGWSSPEEAIGKGFNYGSRHGGQVVGVVKDFHFESLHQSITPIVFMISNGRFSNVLVRVKAGEEEIAQEFLREEWTFLRPGFPYESFLLNENFDLQYAEEDRLSDVITWFSGLAIIIAALGLFGLASFITEQRIKEIGIRKVMGASVSSILILLTKGFTLLVIIGFAISIPLTWYFMNNWLEGFAYSTQINTWSIVFAGMVTIFIAWITVSFRTIRAANSNPVKSLRQE